MFPGRGTGWGADCRRTRLKPDLPAVIGAGSQRKTVPAFIRRCDHQLRLIHLRDKLPGAGAASRCDFLAD